ncbi:uncharacterized protein [Epargyreus clarus]|uniref:uncharacterized protein n=1 Tax=Epargyreus clarus TaxID=520877 RepID=UPI003C2FE317
MCTTCCKEFQGWCRAFTVTEVFLSILQAILLTSFVAFLTFLILHLIACSDNDASTEKYEPSKSTTEEGIQTTATVGASYGSTLYTELSTTLAPGIECTWTPSAKTRVVSQYFEHEQNPLNVTISSEFKRPQEIQPDKVLSLDSLNKDVADNKKTYIMALMKIMSPHDMTFACIVTIISENWAVTAASCIESYEKVNSLDAFIIMDIYLEHEKAHAVSDVAVHPQYRGTNESYNIMLIKTKDKFTSSRDEFLNLPTLIDYFSIAIGERFTIIKFNKIWSNEVRSGSVHEVPVHALPARRCGASPAAARLCAGRLRPAPRPPAARLRAAGAPLLRGRLLMGVGSGQPPYAVTDAPTLYVNLATALDWLNSVVQGE